MTGESKNREVVMNTSKNERKHGIAIKLLALLFTALLAIGFGTGVNGVEAQASTSESSNTITKKEAKAFAKKVDKANDVKKILKKHDSFYIKANGFEVYASKDCAYFRNTESRDLTIYADKNMTCQLTEDEYPKFTYIFDPVKEGDMYYSTYAYRCMDVEFTAKRIYEDHPISLVNNGKTITFISKLNKKSKTDWLELMGIEGKVSAAYNRIVVDAETYKALEWSTYTEGHEDDPEGCVLYYYDAPLPEECTLLRQMAYRASSKVMSVTLVRDAGTENEYTRTMVIPVGSNISFLSEGLEQNFYADPEYTTLLDSWDCVSDITFYVKSLNADETTK